MYHWPSYKPRKESERTKESLVQNGFIILFWGIILNFKQFLSRNTTQKSIFYLYFALFLIRNHRLTLFAHG